MHIIFHDQPEWKQRAIAIKPMIYMATEYLSKNTKLKELLKSKKRLDVLVTYHDPCHARKNAGCF